MILFDSQVQICNHDKPEFGVIGILRLTKVLNWVEGCILYLFDMLRPNRGYKSLVVPLSGMVRDRNLTYPKRSRTCSKKTPVVYKYIDLSFLTCPCFRGPRNPSDTCHVSRPAGIRLIHVIAS